MAFPNTPSQKTPKNPLKVQPQDEGKFGKGPHGKKMNAKAMAQAMRAHKAADQAEATENDAKLMAGYSKGHGMGSG
jgi:hypothetical protein